MTNDIDLSVAQLVADGDHQDIEAILRRADPTFEPVMLAQDRHPCIFRSESNFQVEMLTKYGRGRKSPVLVKQLNCSAVALSYHEYLVAQTTDVVALYGRGVRVPAPERYAAHKLIVAQHRSARSPKRSKDLEQARALIDVLRNVDSSALDDAISDARDRGDKWRRAVDASLSGIGRQVWGSAPRFASTAAHSPATMPCAPVPFVAAPR